MINVYDHAHALARALKQSQELQTFKTAREKVMAKESARNMLADFEKRRLEMQSLVVEGKEPAPEQQQALQKLYEVITLDADLRDYLQAEMRLAQTLGDIYKIIGEAVELPQGLKG